MNLQARALERARDVVKRILTFHAEAEDQFRNIANATAVVAFDTFVVLYFAGTIAIGLARRWQADTTRKSYGGAVALVAQFPLDSLYTVLIVVAWTLLVMRWLRYIQLPRWWAVPYVIVILCPAAWLLGRHFLRGVDSLVLVLLQAPIIVSYVRRFRARAKRREGQLGR
jgi:hypothetical protein